MCITGDRNDSVMDLPRAWLDVTKTKQTEIEFDDRTCGDSIKPVVPNSTQSMDHFCKFSTTTDHNLLTLPPPITSCFLICKSTVNCAKIYFYCGPFEMSSRTTGGPRTTSWEPLS